MKSKGWFGPKFGFNQMIYEIKCLNVLLNGEEDRLLNPYKAIRLNKAASVTEVSDGIETDAYFDDHTEDSLDPAVSIKVFRKRRL